MTDAVGENLTEYDSLASYFNALGSVCDLKKGFFVDVGVSFSPNTLREKWQDISFTASSGAIPFHDDGCETIIGPDLKKRFSVLYVEEVHDGDRKLTIKNKKTGEETHVKYEPGMVLVTDNLNVEHAVLVENSKGRANLWRYWMDDEIRRRLLACAPAVS